MHVDGAKTIATFAPTGIRAAAAITTTNFGEGRITYVGTVPNELLAHPRTTDDPVTLDRFVAAISRAASLLT